MWLINQLKVGVAKIADIYTASVDPFDEFTRASYSKFPTLDFATKEELFFTDLVDNFTAIQTDKLIIWNYKKSSDGSLDLGDQALWHGVTTYMLCLKYSQQPNNALSELIQKSAQGMLLHQRVNWEKPRLVRGVKDSVGMEYQDDASNDTLTGHLLGIYGLLKLGPMASRAVGEKLARNIADSLLDHKYCLINSDGTTTTYGKLVNGVLTDALNLNVCLLALKLASSTWSFMLADYEVPYQVLVKKHKEIIPYAHVTLGSLRHDYDAHRSAISYSLLADLEKDHDINRYFVSGLIRSWKRERKSRNPWIYFLMRRIMLMDPTDFGGCLQRLEETEVLEKSNVQERKNSLFPMLWKERGIRFFEWGGHIRSSQPLPLWQTGSQDFFWQRCQYSVDDWGGLQPGQLWHNGLDFLVCYWGFQSLKLLQ